MSSVSRSLKPCRVRHVLVMLVMLGLLVGPWTVAVASADPSAESDDTAETGETTIGEVMTTELSPEVQLSVEMVSGPMRNADDGSYSVTYELVITQMSDGTIEPLSLLGFTATSADERAEDTKDVEVAGVTVEASTGNVDEPEIEAEASLTVTKRMLQDPEPAEDGGFDLRFEVAAKNSGEQELSEVQLVEDLAEVFGPGAEISIQGASTSGPLTPNRNYDGSAASDLLAGADSLAAGQSGAVTVMVEVVPEQLGTFPATASGMATAADGSTVASEAPASFVLEAEQKLDVELRMLSEAVEVRAGVFEAEFGIIVTNSGPFRLTDFQIHESFAPGDGVEFAVVDVEAVGFENGGPSADLDPRFDGVRRTDHLEGGAELEVGESHELLVRVASSNDELQKLRQQVIASGNDPFGTAVADGSLTALMTLPKPTTAPTATSTAPTAEPTASEAEPAAKREVKPPPAAQPPAAEAPDSTKPAAAAGEAPAAERVATSGTESTEKKQRPDSRENKQQQDAAEVLAATTEADGDTADSEAALDAPFAPGAPAAQTNFTLVLIAGFAIVGMIFGFSTVIVNIRNSRRTALVDEWLTGG